MCPINLYNKNRLTQFQNIKSVKHKPNLVQYNLA